jgi:pimeloyl-ACP methyl ester carboxylesterase
MSTEVKLDQRIRDAETRLFARGGLQPGAALHEVPGGHGPWLDDPAACAKLVADHLAATGFARAV